MNLLPFNYINIFLYLDINSIEIEKFIEKKKSLAEKYQSFMNNLVNFLLNCDSSIFHF